jgi:glycosyltransferase involved in cell wall biosynthesis
MTPNSAQNEKSIVHVAMLGARLHYAVPLLLDRAGVLGTFYTDTYLGNKPRMRRLLELLPPNATPSAIKRLQGRTCADLSESRVWSYDQIGLLSYWLRRKKRPGEDLSAIQARINQTFGERVVASGLNGGHAIYGFNGASLEIFRHARALGLHCILEQTIAPFRMLTRLLTEEAERWPGWEPVLSSRSIDNILAEREEAEWQFADQIVCGSSFVEESLCDEGVAAKCQTVPYGIDLDQFKSGPKDERRAGLNLLFVGEVGLRKGIPYLLEALRHVNSDNVRCRLVGRVSIDRRMLADFDRWIEIVGSVPRARMQKMYEWADALVLPSICEGSAFVTYEAMASGLPIIATPNTGSVIRDQLDGFVVPIRDAFALAERIDQLSSNKELARGMAHNALERIQEFSWDKYGERLLRLIREVTFNSDTGARQLRRAG